jgi:Raf kinase inhibitor-like YbhB/YbcL family protein
MKIVRLWRVSSEATLRAGNAPVGMARGCKPRGRATWGMFLVAALVLAATLPAGRLRAAGAQAAHGQFRLLTSAFSNGQFIPVKYTCSGSDVSPELHWQYPPAGTKSFVVIMYDPDAPGGTWVHWLAYNLPAKARSLPEGVPEQSNIPGGGVQGTTSFGKVGYGGPCPPPGDPHHYHVTLYAVDTFLRLRSGATRPQIESAMKGRILGRAELVGLYRK